MMGYLLFTVQPVVLHNELFWK